MSAFLFRSGFAHAVITKRCSKTITWLLLSRLQGNKPLLNLPKPWLSASTNRNPPEPSEPASGTYTSTHRNPLEPSGNCLRNLHHHTPGPSRTFRNLPPEPTPAHTGTLRNLPEPASGTYTSTRRNPADTTPALRNLPELASGTYTSTHRNLPEPSGTFLRNLLLRPAPAHTGAYLGWRPH